MKSVSKRLMKIPWKLKDIVIIQSKTEMKKLRKSLLLKKHPNLKKLVLMRTQVKILMNIIY
jgi:hypothetical protein